MYVENLSSFKKFWLNKAKIINWQTNPKNAFVLKKSNKYHWYLDGKLNIYENCITEKISIQTKAIFKKGTIK